MKDQSVEVPGPRTARVKVNAICPAAIKKPMLKAGFEGRPSALVAIHQAHPAEGTGLPEKVAHWTRYLIAEAPDFPNGSCLGLNRGISARLHDPVEPGAHVDYPCLKSYKSKRSH